MYWADKKEIAPDQVKKLPSDVEVHLEGRDRYGELVWLEGRVVQSGKKKVFSYFDAYHQRCTKDIKAYPNKKWTVMA